MDFSISPPKADKQLKILEKHGHKREDPYFWMNERDNHKVIEHLRKENEYTSMVLADTLVLQDKLYNEIKSKIQENDITVPYKRKDYYYYARHEKGREYPVYCRKKDSLDSIEEIFFDTNQYAKDHEYCEVYIIPSPDNRLFALLYDNIGRFYYSLRIYDFSTGNFRDIPTGKLSGDIAFTEDSKKIVMVEKDPETLRSSKAMIYDLDTGKTDFLFEEEDTAFNLYLDKSADKKSIFLMSSSTVSDEVYLIDAIDPCNIQLFSQREKDILYSVDSVADRFYILAGFNKQNFGLFTAAYGKTARKDWKPLIPSRENVDIENMVCFDDYIVLTERENGLKYLRILSHKPGTDYRIDFGLETYTADSMPYTNEAASNTLRYYVESLNTPTEIYDFDLNLKTAKLLKKKEVLPEFSPDDYALKRLNIKVRDNTIVPVSLVYRKELFKKGTNPLFITGYGSYGFAEEPFFSHAVLSLLDRGFVYAIGHIRGGSDLGRGWYEDGKLLKKKNTFFDFIDITKGLIKQEICHEKNIFAMGGSAGGLLMGVIANYCGELYNGIIASVPFVDTITTMLDESIPLTTFEYDEWGDPNDKKYYDYMLSYSPYDNITEKPYPNMLIMTGYNDSQVQYWEPAKWAAKLREKKTSDSIILFDCDMASGHAGPSGRYKNLKVIAKKYAFVLDLIGIKE